MSGTRETSAALRVSSRCRIGSVGFPSAPTPQKLCQKALPATAAMRKPAPRLDLAMQFIEAVDGVLGQLFGIDFGAAIGSGADAVRQMRAIAFHLARGGIVQQRAHRGGADVEAYNVGIGRRCTGFLHAGQGAHDNAPL